jgi:hypothetical protein
MKHVLLMLFSTITISFGYAQQLRTPQPSPAQTIKQDFGLGSIEINYSRPAVRGRKIFGDVVPYGSIWRTGANSATTIIFSDEISIEGTKVPAGKYGLLTIPAASEWVVIISKQTNVTSADEYKQDQDVVRVKTKPVTLGNKVENFTIAVDQLSNTNCILQLQWDQTGISFPISTEIDSKVMKQIESIFIKDNRPYYGAAYYYMENGKDLNQALTWFNKAAEGNPDAYWIHYQKARCLQKMGKKKEAMEASMKSLELARKENDPAYINNNLKLQSELK